MGEVLLDGEVETVAVAGDVMWEEVESRKDNVDWGAYREGELVDGEMWGWKGKEVGNRG